MLAYCKSRLRLLHTFSLYLLLKTCSVAKALFGLAKALFGVDGDSGGGAK